MNKRPKKERWSRLKVTAVAPDGEVENIYDVGAVELETLYTRGYKVKIDDWGRWTEGEERCLDDEHRKIMKMIGERDELH
jgi:hypothetical protein